MAEADVTPISRSRCLELKLFLLHAGSLAGTPCSLYSERRDEKGCPNPSLDLRVTSVEVTQDTRYRPR